MVRTHRRRGTDQRVRPDDVAVTGLGLITPAGIGAAENWATLVRGESLARTEAAMAGMAVDFACAATGFDPRQAVGREAWRMDRFVQMAIAAARQAVADAALVPGDWDATRVGVVIGVGSTSMETWMKESAKVHAGRHAAVSPLAIPRSVPNMAAGEIAIDLGAQGPNLATSTACASGATALGTAMALLRSNACDIVLAGGSEAPRACPVTALCFSRMTALSTRTHDPAGASRPFDADRDGFVLGEGAGVLVLERAAHARARGARVRAHLAGYGASADAYHPTAPEPGGRGLEAAMRAALADAGLAALDIDHVNAHATSTQLNDLIEAAALGRVFKTPPPVTASKSIIGHAIGGAGAIEAAFSVLALEHQMIPPTANLERQDPRIDLDVVAKAPRARRMRAVLSNSLGFGGQNAVLVITAP
ncbi:beta-ketoacyl-[acyl-carrier-protein] synthase family protein [Streptomyces sp. NPDC003042]